MTDETERERAAEAALLDIDAAFEAAPDDRADLAMAVVSIALSGAYLWAGWNLPPNPFEPVGSGTIPNAVAMIGIALGAWLLGKSLVALRRPAGRSAIEHWGQVAGTFACTALYVQVLSMGIVRYAWATLVYGFLVIVITSTDRRRAVPGAFIFAAALAFGVDLLFRHVFSTDIP